jgi:hypothetical protein
MVASAPGFTPPTAEVALAPGVAGPVAEGFFSRNKSANGQVQIDGEASSASSVPVVGASPVAAARAAVAPKRDKRNLLPKIQPTKVRPQVQPVLFCGFIFNDHWEVQLGPECCSLLLVMILANLL